MFRYPHVDVMPNNVAFVLDGKVSEFLMFGEG